MNTPSKQDDTELPEGQLRTSGGASTSQDADVLARTTSTVRHDMAQSNRGTVEAYTDHPHGADSSKNLYQVPPQKIN